MSLKELYEAAPKVDGHRNTVLRCIRTYLVPGIPVMVVFIRHRSKKNEWLAILSTDLTLTPQEVISTIVFSRYILLAWQHRQSSDDRTLGGLFYALCDEVSSLDWTIALQQLVELINEIVTKAGKKLAKLIQSQLQLWIAGLPNYIKSYLRVSVCES